MVEIKSGMGPWEPVGLYSTEEKAIDRLLTEIKNWKHPSNEILLEVDRYTGIEAKSLPYTEQAIKNAIYRKKSIKFLNDENTFMQLRLEWWPLEG